MTHSYPVPSRCRLYSAIIVCGTTFLFACGAARGEHIESLGGSRYQTDEIVKTIRLHNFENLTFTSSSYLSGSLKIRTHDVQVTEVRYKKRFKASSIDMAREFSNFVQLSFEELENEFVMAAETRSSPPWRGSDHSAGIEVEILTPPLHQLRVYIRSAHFDIDIDGNYAAADVNGSYRDVNIRGITSKVTVSCDFSSVTVRNCTGPTFVRTTNRPILLQNVDSQLGTIRLRNSNGRITLESVRGEIDARTDLAAISATNIRFEAGRSVLSTENSPLTVRATEVNGDLTLRNVNNKALVYLPENVSANLVLEVEEGGRIYTRGLPISVDYVSRRTLRGSIGSGQNKILVDMAGVGTINLESFQKEPLLVP